MKLALTVLCTVVASTSLATAEPKRPRAIVCQDFRVLEDKAKIYGLCLDGKRPKVLTAWATVRLEGRTLTVGW